MRAYVFDMQLGRVVEFESETEDCCPACIENDLDGAKFIESCCCIHMEEYEELMEESE